jgi:hypothetical protein
MVSLGPGGSDIDGHQISYIGEARSLDKKFHVIGSAEPRLRGDAWRLMLVTDRIAISGKTLTQEQATSFQERLPIRYRICAAMERMIRWAITRTHSGGTLRWDTKRVPP